MADLGDRPRGLGESSWTAPIPGLLLPSALRIPGPTPAPLPPGIDVTIDAEDDSGVKVDAKTGAMIVEEDDGSVVVDFDGPPKTEREGSNEFGANLAFDIDPMELSRIAGDLFRGVQIDDQSRREWLDTRAQGIRILGLKIEAPRTSIDTTASLEGMSNVRHPMLLEATLRFQANARGELLPSAGPVKVADKLNANGETDKMAEALEDGFNYYLTVAAPEYYPDTDRALFYTGFGGCSFKKVYNCPLRERPVSESVDAKDLIVSNASTDMHNAGRLTHVIRMRQSVLKRMQLVGAYRDVPISIPSSIDENPVDRQIANTQGVDNQSQQLEDRDHLIYEVYCELNIRGYEDKRDGKPTGLHLPYRVVLEKDSQQVLEVRRNWKEDDKTKMAKVCFVKYPYVPGLGFYDIGLVHILGNTTNALTAGWRELLDAGMFNNFPGFLYSKLMGRQNTNEFRVPPGGGQGIETNGMSIKDAVMPLPYKPIDTAFTEFLKMVEEDGQRLGGTAEIQVAEGRQDAPVGTTLAMIEQATKIEGAVHKRLHAAQAEEFQMLKECFRENPMAFVNAVNARGGDVTWSEETFLAALNDASIVPQADPNTPSHMHRLMKAMAVKQLQASSPGLYDPKAVDEYVLGMIHVDAGPLFAKNEGQPQVPPELAIKQQELADKPAQRAHQLQMQTMKDASAAQGHQRDVQLQQMTDANEARQQGANLQQQALENRDDAMDRVSDERVAAMGLQGTQIESAADVEVERLREKTEDTKGSHAVNAMKAKPKPKPAAKKSG